ncbi:MAG: TlpA family protein disulfide reductase [bacterium]
MAFKIFLCFFLVINVVGCSPSQDSKTERKSGALEVDAPGFTLEDLQGDTIQLSDYKGKVVLLVFTTTWCRYCVQDIPYLKKLYSQYKEKGLEIININIQESKEKVSSFATKHDIPYKILLDKYAKVASIYSVQGVPSKTLIDKNGGIVCHACRTLEPYLETLFGDKT